MDILSQVVKVDFIINSIWKKGRQRLGEVTLFSLINVASEK